jgi:hypothetical protein
MTGRRPILLWSIPHGAAAGNVLRTGILHRVLDADEALCVVLVTPMARDADFAREVAHPRITLEDLPPHQPIGLEARLLALMQAAYIDSAITDSVRIRRQEAQANGTVRWIRGKRLLAQALMPSLMNRPTRYDWSDRLVRHAAARALFDRYQPALLVTSSPGLIFSEVPLLRTAVQRGVWSTAIDPSWDNFTNKLLPVRRVNRLIVWNDLMKDQAIRFHGYQADDIRIAGTPQWDRYFREGVTISRDAFCARIGADPTKRLITLTTTPQELYSHHDHVLRKLLRALRAGAFTHRAQVLVRLHPRDDRAHYKEFENVAGIIIEKPFRTTVRAGDGLAVDVTTASQQHLADTLRHSDVIVNVASTIAVEAAIFDTPVVNIAFDGEQQSEFARSAKRYYQFTHYTNITRHGAVRVAWSPEELIREVDTYLTHPERDADARARVVREQCQFVDGRAAERVADFVLDDLSRALGVEAGERRRPSNPAGALSSPQPTSTEEPCVELRAASR